LTPVTEVEQLKQQNAMLLKRLMTVSRERDALLTQIAEQQAAAQVQP
jgi:hypothetical protein